MPSRMAGIGELDGIGGMQLVNPVIGMDTHGFRATFVFVAQNAERSWRIVAH